jgi:hypothetical protein
MKSAIFGLIEQVVRFIGVPACVWGVESRFQQIKEVLRDSGSEGLLSSVISQIPFNISMVF